MGHFACTIDWGKVVHLLAGCPTFNSLLFTRASTSTRRNSPLAHPDSPHPASFRRRSLGDIIIEV